MNLIDIFGFWGLNYAMSNSSPRKPHDTGQTATTGFGLVAGDVFLGGDLAAGNIVYDSCIESATYKFAKWRLFNLEGALISPLDLKDRPVMFAPVHTAEFLSSNNVDCVSLANNHLQDAGKQGMTTTLAELQSSKVGFCGAGVNLAEATRPWVIEEQLAVLAYCRLDTRYLRQVRWATESDWGVAPLQFEQILEDIAQLPPGVSALLFFHWGREHTWFPPYEDLQVARELLAHKRVACIVGCHSHRIQGAVKFGRKKAFMGLGNFLFPNFHIEPHVQIAYPKDNLTGQRETYSYHPVSKLTYKKWPLVNRLSLGVCVDLKADSYIAVPFLQKAEECRVVELEGFHRRWVLFMVDFLSLLYCLPRPLYHILEYFSRFICLIRYCLNIIRELGWGYFIRKAYGCVVRHSTIGGRNE